MVACWHHCLFLDLQAHKVSLTGSANNTWLSCWAHSGEIANYFSLSGEWLLSTAFWCRIGAARNELAYQSLSEKKNLDYRPASFLNLGKTLSPLIWTDYSTEVLVDGHWDLSCAPRARKAIPKTGTMSDLLAILVCGENPNHILFLPTQKGFFQYKQVPKRHNLFSFLA